MNLFGLLFVVIFAAMVILSGIMLTQLLLTVKKGTRAKAVVTDVTVDVAARLDRSYVLTVKTCETEPRTLITKSGFSLSARMSDERVKERIDEWLGAECSVAYRMTKRGKCHAYVLELTRKEILFNAAVLVFGIAALIALTLI